MITRRHYLRAVDVPAILALVLAALAITLWSLQ